MTAGLTVFMRVWHLSNDSDDSIGGALITGTIIYENVPATITETGGSIIMVQQGYEVPATYKVFAKMPQGVIQELDELEITYPSNHPLYAKHLRVVRIHLLSVGSYSRRNFVHMTVSRSDYAHANQ